MIRALVLSAGLAATTAAAQGDDLISVTYVCEGAVEIPVIFVNPADGPGYAVARIGDNLVGLRSVIAGSGARYRSGDGLEAYQLWSKGDTATISVGPERQDKVLFRDCTAHQ